MANSITPPPELSDEQVGNWLIDEGYPWEPSEQRIINVARRAFRAGADQELEASVSWLIENQNPRWAHALRAARRPKSPSLKEQALALIDDCTDPEGDYLDDNALSIIRRALEALPDD